MKYKLKNRYIHIEFEKEMNFLSWAIVGGGKNQGKDIYWAQVEDNELPLHLDPIDVLKSRMQRDDLINAPALMTSAQINDFTYSSQQRGELQVEVLSTVGLGNAIRVGDHVRDYPRVGTINLVVSINKTLSENAQIEALSIISEARTLSVLENNISSTKSQTLATGTGTDCIILASAQKEDTYVYSGKHTVLGELIGKAVLESVNLGIQKWIRRKDERNYSYCRRS